MQQLTAKKGAVKVEADANGWETFVVPDDIGGRFSVLTAVGLLPIAASGADIKALMKVRMQLAKTTLQIKSLKTKLTNTQQFVTSFTVKVMQLRSW